jgi:hypothetical protein
MKFNCISPTYLRPALVAGLLLLAACSAPAEPTATLSATAPPSETAAPTETATPAATATDTPEPTRAVALPVRFVVLGDFGFAGPDEAAVADMILAWEPDFIATTGDNNYPEGAAETIDDNVGQYYHSYIGNYQGEYGEGSDENRFFPSLGNHDWIAPDAQPHFDYFDLPGNERYYDVAWGPVQLFIVDSDYREPDGIGLSSQQAAWLREALEASNAPWKFVLMHHPPYSSAQHGSSLALRWSYAEWGADAVLAGHDHVYERLDVDGLTYVTTGLGGYPARYVFTVPLKYSLVRYRENFGALFVTVDETSANFQFITIDGEIIDDFTLTLDN